MLPVATGATQYTAPRFNPLNQPLLAIGTKLHPIPNGYHVPLIGCERFEQPSQGTMIEFPIARLHHAYQTPYLQDLSNKTAVQIDFGQDRKPGLATGYLLANHGPFFCEFSFATQLLATGCIIFFEAMLLKLSREPAFARAYLAIFSKGNTKLFLFFAHRQCD
jgi:hypothetical protein